MPKDKTGKFHLGSQRAHAADRSMSEPKAKPMGMAHGASAASGASGEDDGHAHTTLHDHGDGSFHTEGHDGEHVEHPDIHAALSHMAMKHGHEYGNEQPPMVHDQDNDGY